MKRLAKRLLMALGGLWGRLRGGREEASLFCFFATAEVGGAEMVHADIVGALADHSPRVYFTERRRDAGLLPRFAAHGEVRFLERWTGSPLKFYLMAGYLAARLNRTPNAVVLGAYSHFFYILLPRLKPRVRCVDLIHNFGVDFENLSLPHVPRLARRVVIHETFAEGLRSLYRKRGEGLAERIVVIENAVDVAKEPPEKAAALPLRVLYVGRAGPEKRVHLVAAMARRCREERIEARFTLVGDLRDAVPEADREFCEFTGPIYDRVKLAELYRSAHVCLITSEREGFPVSIMEAMGQGAIPVCTAVGGLPGHVVSGRTGFLLPAEPPETVVSEAATALRRLAEDAELRTRLARGAWERARVHFSRARFAAAWREVLCAEQRRD